MNSPSGVFVAVAPNGARRTRTDHPNLPVTAHQIGECAAECLAAGASMIHLHVRDPSGRHSLDASTYERAIAEIRRRVGDQLVIQITTESAGLFSVEEQFRVIREVRPEAASIALRELCPDEQHEAAFRDFVLECANVPIWLQYIVYSADEIERFSGLRELGVIPDVGVSVLAVIGNYAGTMESTVEELDRMKVAASECGEATWFACAFGRSEISILSAAAKRGWNVRVGFENNMLAPDGGIAESNAANVSSLVGRLSRDHIDVLNADALRSSIPQLACANSR